MSSVIITPGKQFAVDEKWTRTGLNQLGTPTAVVPAASITTAELSAGVNTSLSAIGNAIVSNTNKSAAFTVAAPADRAKLFNITSGATSLLVTLPSAASAGVGFYLWLRKADTGVGVISTTPTTSPHVVSLSKQDQIIMLESDGASWIVPIRNGLTMDVAGNVVLLAPRTLLGVGLASFKSSGGGFAFRDTTDAADAPISASDGTFSKRVRNSANISIAALNIDWSEGNSFHKILTAASNTFTFSNAVDGETIIVVLIQDAVGGRTVTWPGTIKWSGGTAPVMTVTLNKADVHTFTQVNGVIYGVVSPNS